MKLIDNLYFYPEKGMLDSNTYVITGSPGVIIDPGSSQFMPALIRDLQGDGILPGDIGIIVNTHLHGDHCGGNEAFREISGAKILCHRQQKKSWDLVVVETAGFFGLPPLVFTEDGYLDDTRLDTGSIELELIPAPGHSPDSICFFSPKEKFLVCGDVLFDQNTGRADLPGGNAEELKQSVERLSRLSIEYLLPGHMGILAGAENVRRNFDFIRENVFRWL